MFTDGLNLLAAVFPLAVGRGEEPDGGSGIAIILISIVAAILVVGAILTLVARKTRG